MTQKFKMITPNNFIQREDGRYVVTIDAASLELGGTAYYSTLKVLRKDGATEPWRNVLLQYEIANNGDLVMYFDETFSARVVVLTDS